MAALPSRKSLENLKRADLQKICKDYGVKANLKSEALIDLLLDTQKPATKTAPSRRSVSVRHSSRAGPSRISSVIIHDTDEEGDEDESDNEKYQEGQSDLHRTDIRQTIQPERNTMPVTRTRKAKEQTRLGVGRPVAAGGSGPRMVTKSMSIPRGQRKKSSKNMRATEATIYEEDAEQETEPTDQHEQESSPLVDAQDAADSLTSLASIDKQVAEALRPLHEQMKSLKSELDLVHSLKAELGQLKSQVTEMGNLKKKVEALTAEVQDLRTHVAAVASLKHSPGSGVISVIDASHHSGSSETKDVTPFNQTRTHPGIAPSTLGKRHRDSSASNITGVIEESQGSDMLDNDNDLTRKLMRPKKRAKILINDEREETPTHEADQQLDVQPSEEEETEGERSVPAPRTSGFTIYNDLDEQYLASAPPTNHLPDFFPPPSPHMETSHSRQEPTTKSTANAAENQQPFSFSFHPPSSNPAYGMFLPSFPYPEPPQSPSPAGANLGGFLKHYQRERTDMFQAFGLPSPARPSLPSGSRNNGSGGSEAKFVGPASLTQRDRGTTYSNINDETVEPKTPTLDSSSNATSGGPGSILDAPAPLLKRTMYGTELDGDTRFGDFGVEGVGNSTGGFWAGGRY